MIIPRRKLPMFNYIEEESYKINLGCGPKSIEGYLGLDIKDYGQDIVWNVLEGIPLADNCVEEFISYHFIEHFTFPEFALICEEMWRVGKNECKIHMHVPLKSSERAYRPPHVSFWDSQVVRGYFDGFVDRKHNQTNQFTVLSTKEKPNGMLSFIVQVNK